MARKPNASPNTHLGEVTWYCDMWFGTLLFVCQDMLGIGPKAERRERFLNTKSGSIEDLWDLLYEVELENGNLGYDLAADGYGSTLLVRIETTLPYGHLITDQELVYLIEDFVEHVRGLPLCDPKKREGAMTEEEFEAANQRFLEGLQEMSPEFLEFWLAGNSGDDPQDDIPF